MAGVSWCPPDSVLRGWGGGPDHCPTHLQQHEVLLPSGQRAGFLIGDGAGVGKGRTVAGIILENYLRGRKKSLW